MSNTKTYLQKNIKTLHLIKAIIASLLCVFILIDVILVMLEKKGYPTFSWVVRDHRTNLIWLTFLFGGLMAKIFYNRQVNIKKSELSGFLAFLALVAMLFVFGQIIEVKIDTPYQLMLLICGGITAYRIWPQYSN